jgi:dCTP deaminase
VSLRLGRWFRTFRHSRVSVLSILEEGGKREDEINLTKEYFVRFGNRFILHPGKFVLGITLEWIGVPGDLAGYVTGKSSWGRRGLIIETAAGIHPGYKGCLALEITNLGEVPLALIPGMPICQLMFHGTYASGEGQPLEGAKSQFLGRRRPNLGEIRPDRILKRLQRSL